MSVKGIFWHEAAAFWPQVSQLIQPCLDLIDTGYAADDLLQAVQIRDKQLWWINDGQAAAITSLHALPQWNKLIVEYLGGENMQEWQDEWFAVMQQYAEERDCKYIEVYGRKGWARMAQAYGNNVETLQYSRKHV